MSTTTVPPEPLDRVDAADAAVAQPDPNPATPAASAAEPATADAPVPSSEGERMFPISYVKELRDEAAKNRRELQQAITDSEAAARQAAEDAASAVREELAQSLGKALGLVGDEVPPDPQVLLEQASVKAQEAQQLSEKHANDARQAKVELALYRAADAAGADASALLDSRSFLSDVAELDPTAKDFAAQVIAAIEKAIEANPRMKRAAAPLSRSGGDLSAGPAGANPITDDTSVDALRKARKDRRGR
ncbi:hypothetical protein ACIBCN_18785 [Nocardia sp. NPDC051052]|uniref:hypothetical protein n=1 Tax=Nocardia sp. NPDC051052 TaxID=3364322 RepID=UPI00378A5480